jgi:hypothetical protein
MLSSVADPGWVKRRIRDEQPGSHFLGLKIWDPGRKNSDPGWKKIGSRIRDKHPGSATLVKCFSNSYYTVLNEGCLVLECFSYEKEVFPLLRLGILPHNNSLFCTLDVR